MRQPTFSLNKPNIKALLEQEFHLKGNEVQEIEDQIDLYCKGMRHRDLNDSLDKSMEKLRKQRLAQSVITQEQRDEIENFNTKDYSKYPLKPCLKSLYFLSRIAHQQQIQVNVPPTIYLGFDKQSSFMYTCPITGILKVKNNCAIEQAIQHFLLKFIDPIFSEYSAEQQLILPRYVIKTASVYSKNSLRLYYSYDSLMADILSLWGNCEFVVQLYNLEQGSSLTKKVQDLIDNQETRNQKMPQSTTNSFMQSNGFKKQPPSLMTTQQSMFRTFQTQSTNLSPRLKNSLQTNLLQRLPNELNDQFMSVYLNDLQVILSNKKITKAFCCSADNLDNLAIMNFRPSGLPNAEKMALDLSRMFQQYCLKASVYGNMSKFVCDFIESESGLVYFLQVKSFECEGIVHEWQQPWTPTITKTVEMHFSRTKCILGDLKLQANYCDAQLICKDLEFTQLFVDACQQQNIWKFKKTYQLPYTSGQAVDRYKKECQIYQQQWNEYKDSDNLCPLVPLIAHFQQEKQQITIPKRVSSLKSLTKFNEQIDLLRQQQQIQKDQEITVCLACSKITELYKLRNKAIVFKSEAIQSKIRDLKISFKNQWTLQDINFVLELYKSSNLRQSLAFTEVKNPKLQRSQTPLPEQATKTLSASFGFMLPLIEERKPESEFTTLDQRMMSLPNQKSVKKLNLNPEDDIAKAKLKFLMFRKGSVTSRNVEESHLLRSSRNLEQDLTAIKEQTKSPRVIRGASQMQKQGSQRRQIEVHELLQWSQIPEQTTLNTQRSQNQVTPTHSHRSYVTPQKTTRDLPQVQPFNTFIDKAQAKINKDTQSRNQRPQNLLSLRIKGHSDKDLSMYFNVNKNRTPIRRE